MDAELEKLVESGKLTTKAAEQLEQLRPGSFCLHKSWGFVRVAEWNRLWTSAKKAMKSSGYFSVPAKKSEPIALRGEPVSRADELLTFFNQTRQSKEQAAALDQLIKFHHEFKDPKTQLQPIVEKIESTAAQNQKLHSQLTFELILARDDLLARVP